ncbi:TetR/AcrR family transcriptional regulator [Streptomyces sp. NPDC059881]|uniref:TetR/AcrR family transcriptional regulator n=1 Tax=Streptomyces sp. NPDC059881 TaxID=3346986 RepID=UPI00364A2EF8
MTFQRARSEEQREIRRQAILNTTAGMLDTMRVGEVGLNALSAQVGLAKSNVLRYFESREAILLELLDRDTKQWLGGLSQQLADTIDPDASALERGKQLAAALARSLAPHRVLCDLLGAQAGVLEHNVSAETVARYKHAMVDNNATLSELARRHVPELDADGSCKVSGMVFVLAGALWGQTQPSRSVRAAYAADPELAALCWDFAEILEDTLATLIAGTLAGNDALARR